MRQSNSKYATYYNKKYNREDIFGKEDIRVLLFKKIVFINIIKILRSKSKKSKNCKR